MRLAETVGSRTLIILSSLGLAGAIAVWLAQPAPAERARGADLRPMRGCMQRRTPPVVKPPPTARTHSEQIHALRQDLARCVEGGVDATLVIATRRDGTVREVKLDGNLGPRPEALRACMNAVVKPVQFPASETELRVEMLLAHE